MGKVTSEVSVILLSTFFDSINRGVVLKIVGKEIKEDSPLQIFKDQRTLKIKYSNKNLYINDLTIQLNKKQKCKKQISFLLNGYRRVDLLLVHADASAETILKWIEFDVIEFRTVLILNKSQLIFNNIKELFDKNYYKFSRSFGGYDLYSRRIEDASLLKYKKTPLDKKNYWITENVLSQKKDQPLSSIVEYFDDRQPTAVELESINFIHILNPFFAPPASNAAKVIKSTFRSIGIALNISDYNINVISTSFPDENIRVPEYVKQADVLDRSSCDSFTDKNLKKLPLVFDVIDKSLPYAEENDFLIFTNMDICVNPHFYNFVGLIVSKGFDAFTINRRTVDAIEKYYDNPELAASDIGYFHPGFDCFIIKKALYLKFIKTKAFVGVRGVDRSLLFNMVALSNKCLLLKNVAMTFHLGNDMEWLSHEFDEYTEMVTQENILLLKKLSRLSESHQRRLKIFCKKHGELLSI